jgi:hypothetical protein
MPPCDADEGFYRLGGDLDEIAAFITTSPMSARERERLAMMLGSYFVGLANVYRRPDLRLVHDATRETTSRGR